MIQSAQNHLPFLLLLVPQSCPESFFLRWSLKRTSDSFYCSDVNTAYGCFYFFFDWNKIIDRDMAADFSWGTSAAKYQELYDWLIG